VQFGMVVTPTDTTGTDDAQLYREVIADASLGQSLGFESAWFIEHHFTDYYPVPSPLVFMSHIAAKCPGLGLGTCVAVTPWYSPIRLAEEISMLSNLSTGDLHIGMGRGTASVEYDAMGIDMGQSREMFAECWDIVQRFLTGERLAYDGQFTKMGRAVNLRPRPQNDRINFYGALGSPPSAVLMAEQGMAPLCASGFPMELLASMLRKWTDRIGDKLGSVPSTRPVMVNCFIADTDEEARDISRTYTPIYYQQQVDHYEIKTTDWSKIRGYESFQKTFESFQRMCDPANLGPWMDLQMIGSADTVTARIKQYRAAGFNKIIVHCATPGIPRAVRHDTLKRFARDVAPRFAAQADWVQA
jgi:alkanesulfonate monooxygenase SsuD/methylene tetrahydromethanopterin reductase-like flavin-dependent oxidoreductase (luciferase family)